MKIGIFEFCPRRPDLVVSGINSGLNAGINVLYSGTVAAAIEGAFFGITSVAVSLEFDEHADFAGAARPGRQVIEQILEQKETAAAALQPEHSDRGPEHARAADARGADGLDRYGEQYEKRIDPRGRSYFWATMEPRPPLARTRKRPELFEPRVRHTHSARLRPDQAK